MISSNDELYAAVEKVSNELRRSGEQETSDRLESAILISSLPGEILGELRMQLRSIRTDPRGLMLNEITLIDECLTYLDETLH